MRCKYCQGSCIKKGRRNGVQKYRCRGCRKYQQLSYTYKAYHTYINQSIVSHIKESCGIRSISRLLKISATTVIKRILAIAGRIRKPDYIPIGKQYEVDELKTFIGRKTREYWIAYAINRESGDIADFVVGKRTKKTLSLLIDTLILSRAKYIYTDKLNLYRYLIPPSIHIVKRYGINHIERKNLTMRTHLKRLSRKTICYSKSLLMLSACIKIYFWG